MFFNRFILNITKTSKNQVKKINRTKAAGSFLLTYLKSLFKSVLPPPYTNSTHILCLYIFSHHLSVQSAATQLISSRFSITTTSMNCADWSHGGCVTVSYALSVAKLHYIYYFYILLASAAQLINSNSK